MTRVIVDRNAGFCAGVRRAVRGAERLLSDRSPALHNPRSYGQLVHNREVSEALAARGLRNLDSPQEAAAGDTVLLRAHGIPPEEEQMLRARGADLKDYTCPRVKAVQERILRMREEGWRIVIVGDPRHPEVRGLLGYAAGAGVVIPDSQQARYVEAGGRIAVFAQTTITPQRYREVVEVLQELGAELSVQDTLCPFVRRRQRWIREHSARSDASLILGGGNSSNTRKLCQLALEHGPAYHVSRAEELDVAAILKHRVVALTAGASTSDATIAAVLERLQRAGAKIERR